MSSQAMTRFVLLLWGFSAGPLALPADLAAQFGSGRPPGTLRAWIEEARASPFHDLIVSATTAKPTAELAVDKGAGLSRHGPAPDDSIPQITRQRGLDRRVFVYASLAAFGPMVPAFITSFSTSIDGLMWIFLGSAVTLVSVPVAAMAAGATGGPRAIAGSVTGLVAGSVLGMIVAGDWGDSWFAPIYSVTMGLVTANIAVR